MRYTMYQAIFQGSDQQLFDILHSYGITSNLLEMQMDMEHKDRFFYQGMYEVEEMNLGKAMKLLSN